MGKKFYVHDGKSAFVAPRVSHPYFVLIANNWDDYGAKSLYRLEFRDSGKMQVIGDVKIISFEDVTAKLTKPFDHLGDDYLSLGQSLDYYRNLRKFFGSEAEKMIEGLNDAALQSGRRDRFEDLSRYTNSLLRSNDAQRAIEYGRRALENKAIASDYSFQYECRIPYADASIEFNFDFDEDDELPFRVQAIIGRNGVGKTAFLARLALDLAEPGLDSASKRSRRDQAFPGSRPLFSRVIALSFSAFDEFRRPKPSEYISYIYCGVKDDEGRVTKNGLRAKHLAFLERVATIGKRSLWKDYVSEIIGSDANPELYEKMLAGSVEDDALYEVPTLSSGQNTLIYCISALLAYVKPGALILFDEPELHLHPNAVALLMKMLQEILKSSDCYAVIATHSSLVLQDIPAKRVTFLKRTGNLTVSSHLSKETFGEDIAPLTEMVFETMNVENYYKEVLDQLARKRTFKQVLSLFDGKLSLNAAAYLRSRYMEDDTEKYDSSEDR